MSRLLPLLGLLALALATPQGAAASDYTTRDLKVVASHIGPKNDTDCTVDARIYVPAGVDAAHPAAAILSTNGFGGSKDSQDNLGKAYASRGYVVLAYSGLGFGNSGCKIELDSPDWDGKAASAMIDYLGGGRADTDGKTIDFVKLDARDHDGNARAHDPRVGMIGGSYGGQVQFAAANIDSRLDTIVPQITWNDLAYSLAPNNSSLLKGVTYDPKAPGVEKVQWTSAFFAIGVAGTGTSGLANQDPSHFGQCPNFDDQACQIKAQMDATGYADEAGIAFARQASVGTYMAKIKIPTFLAQGQADTLFNLNEAVATYDALRAQGTPVKMLWRSAGHSGGDLGKSEDDETNLESGYAARAYLEWFDYYLRGFGDPPALDFSYFRDYISYPKDGDAAPAVATAPSYPVSAGQPFFLSGTGDLVASKAAIKAGAPAFQFAAQTPTSYSETSAAGGLSDPSDAPNTFAAFTSPVLTSDTDVVGIPKVTVSLDAPIQAGAQGQDPGGRLVLFAKLYEITKDGATVLPNRLIAPVRVQDVTKPVTITLPGIVHRFAKGSKFQLVLAASDSAYKNNNLAGQVTVKVDPKAPSEFDIPVLGYGNPAPVAAPAGSQSPGAGVQPQVTKEGNATQAASLPKQRTCARNRRVIHIRIVGVHKPDVVVSRVVTVNGKRVRVGKRGVAIDLRHKRAGSYRIVVVVKSKRGKVRRSARTYKIC